MAKRRQPRRSYTEEDRAACLAALVANGGNLAKTARQVGVPRKTLAEWAKELPAAAKAAAVANASPPPPPLEKVSAAAAKVLPAACNDLADKLEAIAHQIADTMPARIEDAKLPALAVALGITVEKMRLLREQSTANVAAGVALSLKALTDEQLDQLGRLAEALSGAAGGPVAGGDPPGRRVGALPA